MQVRCTIAYSDAQRSQQSMQESVTDLQLKLATFVVGRRWHAAATVPVSGSLLQLVREKPNKRDSDAIQVLNADQVQLRSRQFGFSLPSFRKCSGICQRPFRCSCRLSWTAVSSRP